MKISQKVRLLPNKEQEYLFIKFSNVARFVYNFVLGLKLEGYKSGIQMNLPDLLHELQKLKYSEGNDWLLEIPEAVQKQAIKDMLSAFSMFYKRGYKGFPKFKKKGKSRLSFYQRTDGLRKVDEHHVKITGIKNPVKVNSNMVIANYQNPRVSFDGKYWYLTFSYEVEECEPITNGRVIGLDLGVRKLATCSDGWYYENINDSTQIRKLESRKARLQRKLSKKYQCNKQGNKFIKTNNIVKLEKQIRLIDRRLKNIRETYIHEITSYLVKTKPSMVVIEDLDVSSMLKNKYLSKAIKDCSFYKLRTFLQYKCQLYGVKLVIADRYYASSKICSGCRNVYKSLGSSEMYVCPVCGKAIDRDLNASYNLRNYGLRLSA